MKFRTCHFACLSWLYAAMAMSFAACAGDSSAGEAGAAASSGRASSGGMGGKSSAVGGASAAGGSTASGGRGGSSAGAASGGSGGKAANGGGTGAAAASGGAGGSSSSGNGTGETGRLVGITDAHNAVRARIMDPAPDPALPPMKWSTDIAKVAQAYADKLAKDTMCQNLVHSMNPAYGENLAEYGGVMAASADVVEGWAAEEECLTFGPITSDGSECDMSCATKKFSNGCGHYTQVVWRKSTELGCGVATCGTGRQASEVWVCNYHPAGNIIGQKPY